MDLVGWSPVVTRLRSRSMGRQFPSFYLRAELQCLICGEATTAKSPKVELRIHERTQVDHFINPPIIGIKQPRACDTCGIVSAIPPKQVKQLTAQMNQKITMEWIQRQIDTQPLRRAQGVDNHEVKEHKLRVVE